MRRRLPRALAGLTAAAAACTALALAPAGAATVPSHRIIHNATPSCGSFCANYFVLKYGPGSVLDNYRGRHRIGNRVILFAASNSDPNQDWTVWPAGTVQQLASFGLVSQALALNYGADQAFEIELAPYGVGTGKCAGTAKAASDDEPVTLQWCGRTARTIWVADSGNADDSYEPLISGSDTDFSDPQVLTEPGWPIRRPRPDLTTYRLQRFADNTVFDDQMWNNTIGVLP